MTISKKDYLKNKFAAEELVDTIRDWWHRRGFTGVRVWIETDQSISEFGTKLPPTYSVRSNISFKTIDNMRSPMID